MGAWVDLGSGGLIRRAKEGSVVVLGFTVEGGLGFGVG